jgi:hypothetical protein
LKFRIDKEKKYILIAGAVLLLFGLAYRLFPFFQGIQGSGAEINIKERQLAKYQKAVKERNDIEARLVSMNRSLERSEAGLLTGKTAALAAVDIQNILNEIASRNEVEIRSVRVLKSKELDDGHYIGIPVQFTLNSTVRQLKEILYRIEASPKLLTVERIIISVVRQKGSRQIRSDITVCGFMKKAEG